MSGDRPSGDLMSGDRPAAALAGLGGHHPAREVSNAELAAGLGSTDEWIRARTGFVSRRLAGPDETVISMAVAAGGKALADAGAAPETVDLLLLATCTAPTAIPPGAPQVAARLGCHRAGGLDLNGGCAGFCYALALAADTVRAGSADTVLVVGSERLSDWVDWTDRSTAVLFADGAGAAVVRRAEVSGVGPVSWGMDGDLADLVGVPPETRQMTMRGQPLFKWTASRLPDVARDACHRFGIEPSRLAALVAHQANLRIVDAVARALHLPDSVVIARDGATAGNTSAASVPLALTALRDSGQVGSGDPVLLIGFGAGLSWAAQVVRCP